MSKDTPLIGGPSSWSSDEPAAGPAIVHNHPLPMSVRVVLVIYGLTLGLVLGSIVWFVISGQNQAAKDQAAVVTKVEADIEKAKAAQATKDAAANEQTRVLVCRFLLEFNQTTNVQALASQFRCASGVPATTPPAPGSSSTPATPGQPSPRAAPRAAPPSPHRTRRPPPSPSPTKSCLLPKPLPCTPVTVR